MSGAVILGILAPAAGEFLAPLVTPIVVFLVYSSLRDVQLTTVVDSRLSLMWPALAISYVGLPLTAKGVGSLLLSGSALMSILIVVAAPTTAGSAIVWTRLADGDAKHAAVVALTSILLSPIVMPGILAVLSTQTVGLAAGPVIRNLLVVIGGALVLKWLIPDQTIHEIWVQRGSLPAIVVLVYVSVATSNFTAIASGDVVKVGIVALALVGAGLVFTRITRTIFRLSQHHATAVFFAGSLKNLGISLLVTTSLGTSGVAVGVTVFYVVQQIASSVIAERLRTQN